jgi:hypothetical protein
MLGTYLGSCCFVSNNKNTKSLLISLIVLLVFAVAAMALLVVNSDSSIPKAFFARSINDASYDCEAKIDKRFKSELTSKSFDNLSSRYEPLKRQYLIYYRIGVREKIDDYYVNTDRMAKCIVWERLGYVSDFRILDI